MKYANLSVVGIDVADLDGKERLTNLLERLSPDVIVLGMSQERAEFLSKHRSEEIKQLIREVVRSPEYNPRDSRMTDFLEFFHMALEAHGYESKVPKDYVKRRSGSRLEFIEAVSEEATKEDEDATEGLDLYLFEAMNQEPAVKNLFPFRRVLNPYVEFSRRLIQHAYGTYRDYSRVVKGIITGDQEILEKGEFFGSDMLDEETIQILRRVHNLSVPRALEEKIRVLHRENRGSNMVAVVNLTHLPILEERISDLEPLCTPLSPVNPSSTTLITLTEVVPERVEEDEDDEDENDEPAPAYSSGTNDLDAIIIGAAFGATAGGIGGLLFGDRNKGGFIKRTVKGAAKGGAIGGAAGFILNRLSR